MHVSPRGVTLLSAAAALLAAAVTAPAGAAARSATPSTLRAQPVRFWQLLAEAAEHMRLDRSVAWCTGGPTKRSTA